MRSSAIRLYVFGYFGLQASRSGIGPIDIQRQHGKHQDGNKNHYLHGNFLYLGYQT
jgi:hypothetical protein